jgi:uncharacterized protein YqgC (DUF456 family)
MAVFFIILSILLSLVGIAGAILPGIPGPQLGFLALVLIQLSLGFPFSRAFIIIWGIINLGLIVIDYLLPVWGTKKFGGTKWGNT